MEIFLYSLIAILIAWTWIDYFRLIDVFEKENILSILLVFLLGGASVLIVIFINKYVFDSISFQLNGNYLNDFIYCFIGIGLVEEIAKAIPFFIIYLLKKKEINEPIDFLIYISVSALGFSAIENVLYLINYGPSIINGRAILSTVSHMFNSSLVAYGIVLFKFRGRKVIVVFLFVLVAALSHGIYDFLLFQKNFVEEGLLLNILYFFITVSLFATILNNTLNNSSFFTLKKVVNTPRIVNHLLTYYLIILVTQFAFLWHVKDLKYAFIDLTSSLMIVGPIIIVTVLRLSRFKLIKGRWETLKLELPFKFVLADHYYAMGPRFHIVIKGNSYVEANINAYYQEHFNLIPVSSRRSYLGKPKYSFLDKKILIKNDEVIYIVNVFDNKKGKEYETFVLKPKVSGMRRMNEKFPIVAVLMASTIPEKDDPKLTTKEFRFLEWAFLAPIDFAE